MSQALMCRLPQSRVRRTGTFSCVEDFGELKPAFPGSDGYYRFSNTSTGCKPLAVVARSKGEIDAFFKKWSNRGIDNTLTETPDIYMGYRHYEPQRFGRRLRPVGDVAMNLFDSATQLVPIVNVMTNAAGGTFSVNGGFALNHPDLGVPWTAGDTSALGRAVKESLLGLATLNDGGNRVPKQKKGAAQAALLCAVFSYFPQSGMTRVARGRLHFGDIDYSRSFDMLFAA